VAHQILPPLLSSPLVSVVLLLRAYSFYCSSRCYQCHSVTRLCNVHTCTRTHALSLLVTPYSAGLTRAAVLQPPASGWAGILHGLAAHSRIRAGCVRNTRMGGPELHAPQGPRATGFYALHRCRRSSTSSRRERARDEWAVSGGPSRVRASLPQKSLDKRLRFKLSQRRREASIPATKAGNLENQAELGWLALPVGRQPARVRLSGIALASFTGVCPQINSVASRVELQRECDAPRRLQVYGPGDLKKDAIQ